MNVSIRAMSDSMFLQSPKNLTAERLRPIQRACPENSSRSNPHRDAQLRRGGQPRLADSLQRRHDDLHLRRT